MDRDRKRPCNLNDVKQYGIHSFLDQVVQGPEPVIEALVRNANIHTMVRRYNILRVPVILIHIIGNKDKNKKKQSKISAFFNIL